MWQVSTMTLVIYIFPLSVPDGQARLRLNHAHGRRMRQADYGEGLHVEV
jgi:hypothetical protein